jgi:hypothetical protein
MRHLAFSALVLSAALGALALACGSFASDEAPGVPLTEAGASETGISEAGATETAPPGACALTKLPTDIATVTSAPTKLQTNGEHVFWIEGGSSIARASLADCKKSSVASGNITALAVDAKWIVWGDPGYNVVARDGVGKPPTTHPTTVSPELILAGGSTYWLDPTTVAACETPCISTTTATIVDTPKLLAANGFRFFVFGVDADAGTTGDLYWQPLLGGSNILMGPIATGQDPILLAANGDHVFWVNADGQVNGVPSGGGPPVVLPKVTGARALAVDDAFVYVATETAIGRVPVNGGQLASVVSGEVDIKSLLVTTDAIVWGTAGAIRRQQK